MMTDQVGTPESRQVAISRMLAEHGRLDVAEAADVLGVAQETVRRDLRALEMAGMLRRVHGGAVPPEPESPVPIPTLIPPPGDHAALAARVWADLPRTGTILLGSGPLTVALVHAILTDEPLEPGLTVVTNSLDAAVHLARIPKLSVYNIGGNVSHQSRAQEGDWALEELSRLRVDVAVLSPAGVSIEHGLSESTPAAAAVAQAQVECADQRIVVCTADTLGRAAFVRYAPLSVVDTINVAGSPEASITQRFRAAGASVELATAPHPIPSTNGRTQRT